MQYARLIVYFKFLIDNTIGIESADNHIKNDVESVNEIKTSIRSILIIVLEYYDAHDWLNGNKVLTNDELKNVFKYSQNLESLSEISLKCELNDNDDCFSEYKDKCFENLLKLNIECIIIIII